MTSNIMILVTETLVKRNNFSFAYLGFIHKRTHFLCVISYGEAEKSTRNFSHSTWSGETV